MSHARYLMIEPDTFKIKQSQLFDIQTCQFCGNNDHFYYQKTLKAEKVTSHYAQGIRWVQRCSFCKKTVSYAVV
jgi:hypothetical protein